MADEALFSPTDAVRLIKADACDFFNIKLMKAGGMTNSLKINIEEQPNIRCMLGCMNETRLALTVIVHVHAATRNIVYADLDGYFSHVVDPMIGGMTVKGGMIALPRDARAQGERRPGLSQEAEKGLTAAREASRRVPYEPLLVGPPTRGPAGFSGHPVRAPGSET